MNPSKTQWFFLSKPQPPKKVVTDFSDFELERFQQQFKRDAHKVRQRYLIMLALVGVMLIFMLSTLFTPIGHWLGISIECFMWVVGLLLLSIVALALCQRVLCPACRLPLRIVFGPFCPHCGAEGLKETGYALGPYQGHTAACDACGSRLIYGKGRNYHHHFCTWCGVPLADLGGPDLPRCYAEAGTGTEPGGTQMKAASDRSGPRTIPSAKVPQPGSVTKAVFWISIAWAIGCMLFMIFRALAGN